MTYQTVSYHVLHKMSNEFLLQQNYCDFLLIMLEYKKINGE